MWSRGSHNLQELWLSLHCHGTWTYLDSSTGVLQLADHSLHSIITSHKASNAIAELRLMKGKEGHEISLVSTACVLVMVLSLQVLNLAVLEP